MRHKKILPNKIIPSTLKLGLTYNFSFNLDRNFSIPQLNQPYQHGMRESKIV